MHEIHWGGLVACYLFLAGGGAGALFCSAYYVLSNRIEKEVNHKVALISSSLGTLCLMLGTTMIVLDLTTFQAGVSEFNLDKFFRFINFFATFRPHSMMSIGSWLVTISIFFSIIFTYLLFKKNNSIKFYAVVIGLLSICVASYTALLLGDIAHNFVWSNSILVVLFLISSLSSGVAILLISKVLAKEPHDHSKELEKKDIAILTFELFVILIFSYSMISRSTFNGMDYVLSLSSGTGLLWWLGALVVGVMLPLLINIKAVFSSGHESAIQLQHLFLAAAILVGAFCLRYSVLLAGQYY